MRFIGSIPDSSDANRFGDYLTSIDIANTIEPGASGFSVWVHDDDQLVGARSELDAFTKNPSDERYQQAGKIARKRADAQEKKQRALQKNFIDYRTRRAQLAMKMPAVTIVLIAISVLVAAATKLESEPTEAHEWLTFGRLTDAESQRQLTQQAIHTAQRLFGMPQPRTKRTLEIFPPGSSDILHGQVWRLFTPMFIHYGWVHLLFNMYMLLQLGMVIERLRGTWVMLGLVLLTSLIGNVAQFYWDGPNFGGMSGVIYGLFGYLWIKSVVDPASGIILPKNTVTIMLAWLAMCMVGVIGNVANAAHVAGLLTGMALAHAPTSWKRMKRAMTARRLG